MVGLFGTVIRYRKYCFSGIVTVRNEVAKVMFLHVSVCPQGGGVPGQVPPRDQVHPLGPGTPLPPGDGYCCGRYASYWNAFLFDRLNPFSVEVSIQNLKKNRDNQSNPFSLEIQRKFGTLI